MRFVKLYLICFRIFNDLHLLFQFSKRFGEMECFMAKVTYAQAVSWHAKLLQQLDSFCQLFTSACRILEHKFEV